MFSFALFAGGRETVLSMKLFYLELVELVFLLEASEASISHNNVTISMLIYDHCHRAKQRDYGKKWE